jgi:hypothetical protein
MGFMPSADLGNEIRSKGAHSDNDGPKRDTNRDDDYKHQEDPVDGIALSPGGENERQAEYEYREKHSEAYFVEYLIQNAFGPFRPIFDALIESHIASSKTRYIPAVSLPPEELLSAETPSAPENTIKSKLYQI